MSDSARVESLGTLRRFEGVKDYRNKSVVEAAREIFLRSSDARVRANVIRGLTGVKSDLLVPFLLERGPKDPDPSVREETVELLGRHLDSAGVKEMLEHLRAYDPSPKVRREADYSLSDEAAKGKREKGK